jgi:hypothetical protein
MRLIRQLCSSLALLPLATLPLIACGGGGSSTVVPEGMHYHYVVDKALIPTNNNQARQYGLDLNGDGVVDNQLGMVLSTLGTMGFDIQTPVTTAVANGSIILLADVQTKDFASASAAGLSVYLGDKATAMPAPCANAQDVTCGLHLKGTGTFTLAASSPTNALVSGPIVGGTFTGGPGNITLQIALTGGAPIQLALIGARAKMTGISATGIVSGTIGGALSQDDLNTKVIPAIQVQLADVITRDCTTTIAPDCGCKASSTGKTLIGLFDTTPKDCKVTVEEIQNNNLIKSLLAPDVTIDGVMALSLGISVTAVKGEFTPPTSP